MRRHLSPWFVEAMLWAALGIGLAVFVGIQTDWGRRFRHPVPEMSIEPARFNPPSLTEDFNLKPVDQYQETLLRPPFVITRRPPPPPPPLDTVPTMKKGQFNLVGTTIAPEANIAFLLEKSVGKVRSVLEGKQVNGITVKEVLPERVVLSQGNDQEVLSLKIAVNAAPTASQGVPSNPPPPASVPPAPASAGAAPSASDQPQLQPPAQTVQPPKAESPAPAAAVPAPVNPPMSSADYRRQRLRKLQNLDPAEPMR